MRWVRSANGQRSLAGWIEIPHRLTVVPLLGFLLAAGAMTPLGAQGPEWQFSAQSAAAAEVPPWLSRDSLRAALSYYEDAPEPDPPGRPASEANR